MVEGLFALLFWYRKLLKQEVNGTMEEAGIPIQQLALGFSALLLVLLFPAPILIHWFSRPSTQSASPLAGTTCEAGQKLLQGFSLKNTRIILIPNADAEESYMPFIRIGDFQDGILNSFSDVPDLGRELSGMQTGQQLSLAFNLNLGNEFLVSSFPIQAGGFSACGYASKNQGPGLYNLYYLQGQFVRPASLTYPQQYPLITLLFRFLYGAGVGIVILLIAIGIFGTGKRPGFENRYMIAATILILQGVFVALYAQAVLSLPFAEQRTTLQVKDSVPKKPTHLYVLPLGIDWMNQADLGSSPATVYENGVPLSSPNALHQAIKDDGNGGYSVWNGSLYFSSSDNTDPRTNGRKYELEWPRPIRPILEWFAYMLCVIGSIMLILKEWIYKQLEAVITGKAKKG